MASSVFSRFVDLKVGVADAAEGSREVDILKFLADRDAGAGSQHILNLVDNFRIDGPNGSHEVLVTPCTLSGLQQSAMKIQTQIALTPPLQI
jgi:hypothetical protein